MTDEQFNELRGMMSELLTRVTGGSTAPTAPVGVPEGFVLTPRGKMFPAPRQADGESFVAYTQRVGDYFGGEQQRVSRANAGALLYAPGPLLAKHGGNWVAATEEHLFGDPNYAPDPAWGFSPRPPR